MKENDEGESLNLKNLSLELNQLNENTTVNNSLRALQGKVHETRGRSRTARMEKNEDVEKDRDVSAHKEGEEVDKMEVESTSEEGAGVRESDRETEGCWECGKGRGGNG